MQDCWPICLRPTLFNGGAGSCCIRALCEPNFQTAVLAVKNWPTSPSEPMTATAEGLQWNMAAEITRNFQAPCSPASAPRYARPIKLLAARLGPPIEQTSDSKALRLLRLAPPALHSGPESGLHPAEPAVDAGPACQPTLHCQLLCPICQFQVFSMTSAGCRQHLDPFPLTFAPPSSFIASPPYRSLNSLSFVQGRLAFVQSHPPRQVCWFGA